MKCPNCDGSCVCLPASFDAGESCYYCVQCGALAVVFPDKTEIYTVPNLVSLCKRFEKELGEAPPFSSSAYYLWKDLGIPRILGSDSPAHSVRQSYTPGRDVMSDSLLVGDDPTPSPPPPPPATPDTNAIANAYVALSAAYGPLAGLITTAAASHDAMVQAQTAAATAATQSTADQAAVTNQYNSIASAAANFESVLAANGIQIPTSPPAPVSSPHASLRRRGGHHG